MYTHSNYWGDADVDHSQTIGGDTAKLLGGITCRRMFNNKILENDYRFPVKLFHQSKIIYENFDM